MCTHTCTQFVLRDVVWPYRKEWGDERQAVRDYLKKKYLKHNGGYEDHVLTDDNVKKEALNILTVGI